MRHLLAALITSVFAGSFFPGFAWSQSLTGNVGSAGISEGSRSIEFRTGFDDDGNLAGRIHYDQALTGWYQFRVIGAVRKPGNTPTSPRLSTKSCRPSSKQHENLAPSSTPQSTSTSTTQLATSLSSHRCCADSPRKQNSTLSVALTISTPDGLHSQPLEIQGPLCGFTTKK